MIFGKIITLQTDRHRYGTTRELCKHVSSKELQSSIKMIAIETKSDSILRKVSKYNLEGWPLKVNDAATQQFSNRRESPSTASVFFFVLEW